MRIYITLLLACVFFQSCDDPLEEPTILEGDIDDFTDKFAFPIWSDFVPFDSIFNPIDLDTANRDQSNQNAFTLVYSTTKSNRVLNESILLTSIDGKEISINPSMFIPDFSIENSPFEFQLPPFGSIDLDSPSIPNNQIKIPNQDLIDTIPPYPIQLPNTYQSIRFVDGLLAVTVLNYFTCQAEIQISLDGIGTQQVLRTVVLDEGASETVLIDLDGFTLTNTLDAVQLRIVEVIFSDGILSDSGSIVLTPVIQPDWIGMVFLASSPSPITVKDTFPLGLQVNSEPILQAEIYHFKLKSGEFQYQIMDSPIGQGGEVEFGINGLLRDNIAFQHVTSTGNTIPQAVDLFDYQVGEYTEQLTETTIEDLILTTTVYVQDSFQYNTNKSQIILDLALDGFNSPLRSFSGDFGIIDFPKLSDTLNITLFRETLFNGEVLNFPDAALTLSLNNEYPVAFLLNGKEVRKYDLLKPDNDRVVSFQPFDITVEQRPRQPLSLLANEDELVQYPADAVSYGIGIKSFPVSILPLSIHSFTDTMELELTLDFSIPFNFSAENIQFSYDVPLVLRLEDFEDNIRDGFFQLDYKNSFPLDFQFNFYFVDSMNIEIDSLFENKPLDIAANVNGEEPIQQDTCVNFDVQRVQEILHARRIRVRGTWGTPFDNGTVTLEELKNSLSFELTYFSGIQKDE